MSKHNHWLGGDKVGVEFAKTVLTLVSLGMGTGQLIPGEKDIRGLTPNGKVIAEFCDSIWERFEKFRETGDGQGDASVYEATPYDFLIYSEEMRDDVKVEAVDFHELNVDGKGLWTRIIAVRFNAGKFWSKPDYLIRMIDR